MIRTEKGQTWSTGDAAELMADAAAVVLHAWAQIRYGLGPEVAEEFLATLYDQVGREDFRAAASETLVLTVEQEEEK